jgi:hypothetical protein
VAAADSLAEHPLGVLPVRPVESPTDRAGTSVAAPAVVQVAAAMVRLLQAAGVVVGAVDPSAEVGPFVSVAAAFLVAAHLAAFPASCPVEASEGEVAAVGAVRTAGH